MSSSRQINTVAVVGGGLTAWSAAAALKRRIPSIDVELIATPPAPSALADRIISTLPSIHGFHRDIGLTDADTLQGAESGLRAGTSFEGWAEGHPNYIHAYGPYGTAINAVAFHQLWLRERRAASLPEFDHFSPAAELARAGGPAARADGQIDYGLHLKLARYGELMRAYALHLGVRVLEASRLDVVLRSTDGFVESPKLSDGRNVTADLFVDCTGPAALVHSALESAFIDWAEWLPCDRVMLAEGAPDTTVELMDRVMALPFGWRWAASSPRQSSYGLVYSSAHVDDGYLDSETGAGEVITVRQGRRRDLWIRNCVAIGDSAVSVEPLEWTNLHLAHSQLDRLVAMMPGCDFAKIELDQFNRECGAEADRVRDFLCLHYVCSKRSEAFWKDAANIAPPPSLAHTLSLFGERGRLPYYQEETFSRDSWLAVLLGQGVEPRRTDPLADLVSPTEAARAMAAMLSSLKSFTLPSTAARLRDLNSRGF